MHLQIIFDRPVSDSGPTSLLPGLYDLLPDNKCIIRSLFVCMVREVIFYFSTVALTLSDLRTPYILKIIKNPIVYFVYVGYMVAIYCIEIKTNNFF